MHWSNLEVSLSMGSIFATAVVFQALLRWSGCFVPIVDVLVELGSLVEHEFHLQ
jgi:hypothetical protein